MLLVALFRIGIKFLVLKESLCIFHPLVLLMFLNSLMQATILIEGSEQVNTGKEPYGDSPFV